MKKKIMFIRYGKVVVLLLSLWNPALLMAQSTGSSEKYREEASNSVNLAGPDGVAQNLKSAEASTSTYPQPSWLQPYDACKKRIKEDYGVSLGLSAYWLFQKANDSISDDDDALGGIYRFQGSWVAFGRDTGHPGRLEWRIENRDDVGSYLSSSQLGGDIGATALNTGFGYLALDG